MWLTKVSGLTVLAASTGGSEIDKRLIRDARDRVVVKKFASCFFGTDFITRLVRDNVDTIVLAGCSTSGCVRATAVDASQFGIRPIVAREAVTDRLEAAHEQSLIDIELKYGDVAGVDEIVNAFKRVSLREVA